MAQYQPPELSLKDRVILITGAADGLGKEIALGYAKHGATVILLDKNVSNLEALYDEIVKHKFPEPALYPLDLGGATADDYVTLAENIDKEFGRLDGLVHNAAVMGPITPMQLYNPEDWYKVMQINLNAPFLINQNCIPLLNQAEEASLIFVTDSCGTQGSAYWGAYGVSKAGLDNMMQTLADELESSTNIRINSIDPGNIRTKMRAFAYPAEDPETQPTPDLLVPGFLYLMGSDSKQFTGRSFMAEDFI